jgi:hypothetical protein
MCETGWIVRASSRIAASTRSSRGGDVPLLAQAAVRFTLASGNEAPTSHPLRAFSFAEVTAGFPARRGLPQRYAASDAPAMAKRAPQTQSP